MTRGRSLLGAIAVAAASALLLLARARGPAQVDGPAPSPPAQGRTLAIVPFTNAGEAADGWIGTALADGLATTFSDAAPAVVVPAVPGAAESAERERLWRRYGAQVVLRGSHRRTGGAGRLRVEFTLLDTRSGAVLASGAQEGPADDPAELARAVAGEAAAALGLRSAKSAGFPANREAARLYAQGLQRLEAFDNLGARELLERAVAADPGFALAQAALSQAWEALGYQPRAAEAARRAVDLSGGLPRARRVLVEARWREATRDWKGAAGLYAALLRVAPDSVDYAVRLAEAQAAAGLLQEAEATLAAVPADRHDARVDLAAARVAEMGGDFPAQLAASSRAAARADTDGEPLFAAHARRLQCSAHHSLGEPERALECCARALQAFQAAGDRGSAARVLSRQADVLRYRGDLAGTRRAAEAAIAVAREIGDQQTLVIGVNRLASVDAEEGRLARALAGYREAEELARTTGERTRVATALNNAGGTLLQLGRLAEAQAALEASLAEATAISDRRAQCFTRFNLGPVLLERGQTAEAKRLCTEALTLAEELHFRSGAGVALACLGRVALAEGDLALAARRHQEALAVREQLGERGRRLESRLALAEVHLAEGRPGEAREEARLGAAEAERTGPPHQAALGWALAARAAHALGDPKEARESAARAERALARLEHRLMHWEVALARALIQTDPAARRQALHALAEEAARAGFGRVAAQARQLAGS